MSINFQVLEDIDFSVDEGRIVEVGTPEHFFQNPRTSAPNASSTR